MADFDFASWFGRRVPDAWFGRRVPDAWLYRNYASGRVNVYASIDANDTNHWPIDQWTSTEKLPLFLDNSQLTDAQ